VTDEAQPSYFRRIGDGVYAPTEHVGGAWDPGDQHMSPLGGLIVHELELSRAGRPPMTIGRVSFDILGRIASEDTTIRVRTLRPGRTIELVEAVATIGGRDTVSARAWLLADEETEPISGTDWEPLPAPETLPRRAIEEHWGGGYIRSVDIREARPYRPGRAAAWITTDVALVAGEEAGPLASFIKLIDTANGIAVRAHPQTLMFPNVDLTVHLFRKPAGRWVGLDTTVSFGPTGQGLTSSILHDVDGPVGTVEQMLTVRPLPDAAG
jgi:hypothetical protein